jgi:hypothetical protein
VHRAGRRTGLSRRSSGAQRWLLVWTAACHGPAAEVDELCPARGPAVPWFSEVTATSGLDFDFERVDFRPGAIAVADMDGDGRPDVLAGSHTGGAAVFRNSGDLRFTSWAGGAALEAAVEVRFLAPADLDNDGDVDLVAVADGRVVVHEHRDGALGPAVAVDEAGAAAEHVLAADLDGDGLLDLHLSSRDFRGGEASANRVLVNRGELVFEAVVTGAEGTGLSWTASAFDADGDGDLDLHVANDTLVADYGQGPVGEADWPPDAFYRSLLAQGEGLRFVDVAAEVGLDTPRSSMGGLVSDLDGDGMLDLFVPDLGAKKAFLQQDGGGFREAAAELGLAAPRRTDGGCGDSDYRGCLLLAWGSQAGDFDLDGHDDLVVMNGENDAAMPPPPVLAFRGPPPYLEVDAGLGCLTGGGLVAADLDRDGDLDLVASATGGSLRLYRNLSADRTDGAALSIALRGRTSNRDGAGARLSIRLDSGRTIERAVGAGGVSFATPPTEIVVGLGSDRAASVRVTWPSGAQQQVDGPFDGNLVIEEP